MQGLGLYIHVISSCFGGDIGAIIQFCKEMNVKRLHVKHYDPVWHPSLLRNPELPELSQACMENDIALWCWEFNGVLKSGGAIKNAQVSIDLAKSVNAFGFELNAEKNWAGQGKYAADYCKVLGLEWKGPTALTTYRYPSTHPEIPYAAILPHMDYVTPQLYYVDEQEWAPARLIERSLREYKAMSTAKFIPIWPTYKEWGWQPTTLAVKTSLELTISYKLQGAGLWYLDWLDTQPAYIETIKANHPWPAAAPVPPPVVEPTHDEKVDILWDWYKDSL